MTDLFEQPEHPEALLPIDTQDLGGGAVQTVNARALHGFLKVADPFHQWIKRRVEKYGFSEGSDFCTFLCESSGGRPRTEYALTLDMAKELAMVENNGQGRTARRYFIEMERRAKQAPAFEIPKTLPGALRLAAEQAERAERAEAALEVAREDQAALEQLAETPGSITLRDAGMILTIGQNRLREWGLTHAWWRREFHKGPLKPYADKVKDGLLTLFLYRQRMEGGQVIIRERLRITPKGLIRLAKHIEGVPTNLRNPANLQRQLELSTAATVPYAGTA